MATDLNLNIDFRSGIPIYVQIIEQVQQLAGAGKLKVGDQLPTVRQMAAELRVNFNTVARAYRMLDDAGIISTQHGRGTYILEQPSAETRQELRHEVLENFTSAYLSKMSRMNFKPEEISEEFKNQLASWKKGQAPGENDDENLIEM